MKAKNKIFSRRALTQWVNQQRQEGKKIVFTNGCFDILHAGHVSVLEFSRAKGDLLVVGINSDDSVRRLKGPTRPVNKQADRALVLAS
ncbi:MAG: adenylyltransferase/cytidyltransferase family protein, partial [Elusimicrobiaceae bacterium]|nr:adenylyltransferase/cytidyltransferase family protein [Elusimicrobiaceae bacterium]